VKIGRDRLDLRLFLTEEANFAGGAVGAETVREVQGGSGSGGDSGSVPRKAGRKSTDGKKAGGFIEAKAGSQLAGGGTEDATAEGGVEGAKAV
jgi:hypothetical protein